MVDTQEQPLALSDALTLTLESEEKKKIKSSRSVVTDATFEIDIDKLNRYMLEQVVDKSRHIFGDVFEISELVPGESTGGKFTKLLTDTFTDVDGHTKRIPPGNGTLALVADSVWTDSYESNDQYGGYSVIYFKPSVFGMVDGQCITEVTLTTSDNSATLPTGDVYLQLLEDVSDRDTLLASSSRVTMTSAMTNRAITFKLNGGARLEADRQYYMRFASSPSYGNSVNIGMKIRNLTEKQDLYIGPEGNGIYRPILAVKFGNWTDNFAHDVADALNDVDTRIACPNTIAEVPDEFEYNDQTGGVARIYFKPSELGMTESGSIRSFTITTTSTAYQIPNSNVYCRLHSADDLSTLLTSSGPVNINATTTEFTFTFDEEVPLSVNSQYILAFFSSKSGTGDAVSLGLKVYNYSKAGASVTDYSNNELYIGSTTATSKHIRPAFRCTRTKVNRKVAEYIKTIITDAIPSDLPDVTSSNMESVLETVVTSLRKLRSSVL